MWLLRDPCTSYNAVPGQPWGVSVGVSVLAILKGTWCVSWCFESAFP